MPSDTHPDAARVQLELLRSATPTRRFTILCSLIHSAMASSKRAIQRANPHMSERELLLRFTELHHGAALAERLRRFLESRD